MSAMGFNVGLRRRRRCVAGGGVEAQCRGNFVCRFLRSICALGVAVPASLLAPANAVKARLSSGLQLGLQREVQAVMQMIDWEVQNQLPPWLSNIEAGSQLGVAIVLGQSLQPDGTPSKVLIDRARRAKQLLDEGVVGKVIVSGSDPAGVGTTEAAVLARVLRGAGISNEKIVLESQATTTAENAWFSLRWIPKGTGRLHLVTSDFHMARASYIFESVLSYFYSALEVKYANHEHWGARQYPRLGLQLELVQSSCGSDAGLNQDNNPRADITARSLARRAMDELRYLGTMEVSNSLYGPPRSHIQYIWPVQIDVKLDPDDPQRFSTAMARAMLAVRAFCSCRAPPEGEGHQLEYPLDLPTWNGQPRDEPWDQWQWERVNSQCVATPPIPTEA